MSVIEMKVDVKPFCEICMRINKEEGREEYWGGVGDRKCEKCNRNVCFLHYNSTKKLCSDCMVSQ
jgi:hypothetical protein